MSRCQTSKRGKELCNKKDIRYIQMKSGHNVYEGEVLLSCEGCRSLLNGGYKFVTLRNFYIVAEDRMSKKRVRFTENMTKEEAEAWRSTSIDRKYNKYFKITEDKEVTNGVSKTKL